MSVETRIFCDRCLTLITKDRSRFTLETGPERLTRPVVDLCPNCFDQFLAWVDDHEMKIAKVPL